MNYQGKKNLENIDSVKDVECLDIQIVLGGIVLRVVR
jgi:hypothetical protein